MTKQEELEMLESFVKINKDVLPVPVEIEDVKKKIKKLKAELEKLK